MIIVESKKKKQATLEKKYPKSLILDVTSKGDSNLIKFSPFYPHRGIPIPFSEGHFAECVEGIWQGLKVFEDADIDESMFKNRSMKNIKRTFRKFGKPLGHRKGVEGTELLGYIEARISIYLPSYLWVIENKLTNEIQQIKNLLAEGKDLILLDYATNSDILDDKKPLSHAFLVKAYIEGAYPIQEILLKEKITGRITKNTDKSSNKIKGNKNQTKLF